MDFHTNKHTKSSVEVLMLSDSDEEIFVGPVTEKEKKKAAKLSRRTQVFFPPVLWKSRERELSTPRQENEGEHDPNIEEAVFISGGESPSNGYTADISSAEKTNYTVPESSSLQYGYSADSLNSLSRDSLDIDHDSLEVNKKPVCDSHDTSVVEDLYDAGDYLNQHQDVYDGSVSSAQKQLTADDIAELQQQLDKFAFEMGNESSEKHNNSFETEDFVTEIPDMENLPNIESIFNGNKGIPSLYDLNKQRLSDLLMNDSSLDRRSNHVNVIKDRLDTLREVSEPSSTDTESRLSSIRLSELYPGSPVDSPRKGSTDNLPNSTQLFEELERQIEEEESIHSQHQTTYTVRTESPNGCSSCVETVPDATYTLLSNASEPTQDEAAANDSLNSTYENSDTSNANPCPEGIFNDTLEEMEMFLKYGVDYIYGKNSNMPVNKEVSFEEISRPKSADCRSNHSGDSGRSTPIKRDNNERVPTPVKRTPLTPNKTQPKVHRTPVKTPTGSKPSGGILSGSASNPTRSIPRTLTPRSGLVSSAAKFSKCTDSALKKSVQPAGNETPKFKVPAKIPVSASRVPRPQSATPRASKFLNEIQSPIGAYIHNTPSPVLLKNVKPKPSPLTIPRDFDRKHRPVWDNLDTRQHKSDGSENVNPNVGHGLPTVRYIQAPCIKLDDHSLPKSRLPRLGDRLEKLLDSPCPQVIKHEGRVRVNPSSPQYSAAVKAVKLNLNDSTRSEAAADPVVKQRRSNISVAGLSSSGTTCCVSLRSRA